MYNVHVHWAAVHWGAIPSPCGVIPIHCKDSSTTSLSLFLKKPLSMRTAIMLSGPRALLSRAVQTVLSTPPLTRDWISRERERERERENGQGGEGRMGGKGGWEGVKEGGRKRGDMNIKTVHTV